MLPLSPYEARLALGAAFREHRLAANVTQRELASKAGVSEATVKRIEASGSASLEHVLMVGFALGLGTVFSDWPAPRPASIEDVVEAPARRRASPKRPGTDG